MIYTLDTLIDEAAEQLNVADPQSIRAATIRLLRTDLYQKIGYELVGKPFVQEVTLTDGRFDAPDNLLMITDASTNPYEWTGVTVQAAIGPTNICLMEYDAMGINFPFYPYRSIWVRGYALPVDGEGNVLIPINCYAAALEYTIAKLIPMHPLHPSYGDRRQMLFDAKILIASSRASFAPRGEAAERTQRLFLGL